MLWRLLGVTGADREGGGGITGGGAGGGNEVSSKESSENLSSSLSSLSLNWFRLLFFEFILCSILDLWTALRLFMRLSMVWMLILIPNGVIFDGDTDAEVGDFGRLMKSSFFKINPLLGWLVGDVSSFTGDLNSCDEDEDKSEFGFLRQTSRWRSIEPGRVRGGTRFWGNGPG